MSDKQKTLVLLGMGSLQSYLFRDNKQKHSARASRLVEKAIDWDGFSAGDQIYKGGGHRALLFESRPAARAAVERWMLTFLETAPGMALVAAEAAVVSTLHSAYSEAVQAFKKAEERAPAASLRPALPVVRECPITGQASSHFLEASSSYISEEAFAKRQATTGPGTRETRFPLIDGQRWEWAESLDKLGTPSGSSQLILAHPDLNGAGELFAPENLPQSDEAFRRELKNRSEALKTGLTSTMRLLMEQIHKRLDTFQEQGLIQVVGKQFPFLPLIAEADETTFLLPAKIGFGAVTFFLETIAAQLQQQEGLKDWLEQNKDKKLTASAGTLIMPRGFAFSRAYSMVNDLCSSAKRKRHADRSQESYIDFHLIAEGATGDIDTMRETTYRGNLCANRPYSLTELKKNVYQPWQYFTANWPRSRSKGLLQAIAQGEDKARAVMRLYDAQGYRTPRPDPSELFDPLELLDFLHTWKTETTTEADTK